MRFALTEEQTELVATVRAAVAKRAGSVDLRAAIDSQLGYDQDLWRTLTEQIGVTALAVPEAYGGVGCSYVEAHLVLEELGSTLTPSPYVGAVLATQTALAAEADSASGGIASVLERIAGGAPAAVARLAQSVATAGQATPATVLQGTAELVLDGAGAEVLLVVDGEALYEVDPDACTITPVDALDPTLRLATVTLDDTPATPLGAVDPTLLDAVGATVMTALQAGAARRAHELTGAYLKERQQFGRPLGSFQALKHRVADLLVQVETARTMSWAAAWSVATDQPDVRHQAAVAKAWCSDANSSVAAEMIQLHGGIGITWEHDAHLYFKRAHATAQLFGRPATHRSQIMKEADA